MKTPHSDNQFMPPKEGPQKRSFAWSSLIHLLLILMLALGLTWRRDTPQAGVQAELWSSVPQEAAQQPVSTQTPPPIPKPLPQPSPARTTPPTPLPTISQNDIIQKQKKLAKEKKLAEQQAKLREQHEKQLREAQLREEQLLEQKAESVKAAAKKKKLEQSLAQSREQYLKNMQKQASQYVGNASTQQENAAQASGPSATYAGRIIARVKPNIVYPLSDHRKLVAEVKVWCDSSGKIISRKLIKPSEDPKWDSAVLTALDKTATLPKDTDESVPSPMVISFSNAN